MANPKIWLKRFDRDDNFIVARPFQFSGRVLERGKVFDKTLANTRRLRQLYEQRFLTVEVAAPGPQVALATPAVDWRALPWAQLQKFVQEIAGSRPKTKAEAELLMRDVDVKPA